MTALTALFLWVLPAAAQITIVNDDNSTFTNVVPNPGGPESLNVTPWTVSFDAGATADKLIVALSSETGGSGPPVITYNGDALTQVPGTGNNKNKGIWYLDNPYNGGAADLVIDMTSYSVVNGIGFGVVSVAGTATGTTGGDAAGGLEVSITTAVADSLIVSAYASNTGTLPVVPSGHSPLYASGAIGSASGAAAYRNVLGPAGLQTITYTQATVDANSTSAAGFAPALVITSTTPADNATDAPLGGDLVATFSEPVSAGAGEIELWQAGGGSPVETFNVTIPEEVTFSGQTLTINPTSDLVVGVEYYVLIPPTAVVSTSIGSAFAGIADSTTWSFGDTAPILVTLSPADDAANVSLNTNLVATFSETVQAGTGTIELWKVGGGAPVETFNAAIPSEVAFSGASFTINPAADLDPSSDYYVIIPGTAVVDLSSQAFAGLAGTGEWNFSTLGQTWDGGDADNNWTSVLNWDADVSPDFAKPIIFQGSTRTTSQNDRTAGSTVAGINFINDGTTFTNAFILQGINSTTTNSMTLGGNITTTTRASGSMEDQIHGSLDTILNGDHTITTSLNHNFRFVGGVYETGGSRKLIKEGAGVMTLSSASLTTVNNSFSGGIDINNGVVQLLKTAAAGTGTINLGATSGSANAELRLAVSSTNPTNELIIRTGSAGNKTLANRSTNSVIYKGIITANDNLTILAANNGGRLTVDAAGCTIADGKTVSFSNTGTSGSIMINSATWSGQGSLSYTSNSVMGFQVAGDNTYSGGTTLGAMSGTGVLVATASSIFTGPTLTSGAFGTGTLSIGATKMRARNSTGDITVGNAITFTDNPTFTTAATEQSLIFTGNASLGATRTLTVEIGSTVPAARVEFSGQISGSGFGIIKEGAGNLLLSATNTYTGDTTVNAGVLAVTGASVDNTAKLVINGSGKVALTNTETVAALDFDGTAQPNGNYSASSVPPLATITTASFSGTGTLTVGAPSDPFTVWSGGAAFDVDSNNDGVKNGLAWLLGAPDKETNALDLLPKVSESAGGLVMKFTCLKLAGRGTATLSLQHSGDLDLTDPWSSIAVPDTATTVGTVVFTVPTTNADPDLVDLEALIPVSEALNGKLFGRLIGATP
jgi:autotransporter-associated beta strand protein